MFLCCSFQRYQYQVSWQHQSFLHRMVKLWCSVGTHSSYLSCVSHRGYAGWFIYSKILLTFKFRQTTSNFVKLNSIFIFWSSWIILPESIYSILIKFSILHVFFLNGQYKVPFDFIHVCHLVVDLWMSNA